MVKDLNDPTNVDTVPAMLTPGEFVLNKEASMMFAPMIEHMNNAGLQQRVAENKNLGGMIPEGYNTGGLITFLKDKEGYKDNAYLDSAGVWTIGYGRTGDDVKKGDTTTREAENTWLDTRAAEELKAINDYAKKYGYEWNDGQKNALASFRYNGGQGMIDMLTADGTRDNATIQSKFGLYNKVTNPDTGKKEFVQGLQNRRDAELELWGGTTPTETVEIPPEEQAPPSPDVSGALQEALGMPEQEVATADVAGGFPDTGPDIGGLAAQALAPPPAIVAPPLPNQAAPAEFIPSVTANNLPTSQPLPTEPSNPQANNSLWNDGGPVQYLRGGGKAGQEKVWDSATQKYIWVDRSDPRVEQEKALAASAPVSNNQMKPMGFAQATQPNVTHMGPRQTRAPYQQSPNLPLPGMMQFDRAPDNLPPLDPYQTTSPETPPQIPSDLPPVPGSDEAILRGSSQQVEQQEIATPPPPPMNIPNNLQPGAQNLRHGAQWDKPQAQPMTVPNQAPAGGAVDQSAAIAEGERLRQNALLGDQAKQFPQGDPRRAALFNQQEHQKGAVHPGPVPELPPTPALAGSGAQHERSDANLPVQGVAALPIGHPSRVAAIEDGSFIPTTADLDWDDQRHQTNEALRREQLQAAVTAPDAPAAQSRENRIDALTSQLDALEVPTQEQGVGADVQVGGINAPPELGRIPFQPFAPNEVGAVPGLDATAPLPQDVIDSTPQDLFHGDIIQPTPGETAQALQQGLATDASVSLQGVGEGPVVEGPSGEGITVDTMSPVEKETVAKETASEIIAAQSTSGEPPSEALSQPTAVDTATTAGTAAQKTNPAATNEAVGSIKSAFGDLFDGKELARMAILFAGARLTGASAGQALAFAGQNYINRLDAKQASSVKHQQDLVKGGKYTPGSLSNYRKSGDPADLTLKDAAATYKELGKQQQFFTKGGVPVLAREVETADGSKHWVDSKNNKINLNTHHQDPTRSPATPEFRERVAKESKQYGDILQEQIDRFGKTEGFDGAPDSFATDLTSKTSGSDIAKWAIQNNVPVDGMGSLIQNAYAAARADSKDGKRAKSILPYLNDQYVQASVGDSSLFQTRDGETVSSEKVNGLLRSIAGSAGLTGSDISNSTVILQKARPRWAALGADVQKRWADKNASQSGFMTWLQNELENSVN